MKLSLEVIAYRLSKCFNIDVFKSLSSDFSLEKCLFFTGDTPLRSNILYICKADAITARLKCPRDSALISVGSSAYLPRTDRVLILEESIDIFQLSNEISHIFSEYDQWEKRLKEFLDMGIESEAVFQEMLDISDPIIENGITFMDPSFNFLAMTEAVRKYGGYESISEMADYKRVSPDVMSALWDDPEHRTLEKSRETVIMSDRIMPHRTMSKNLFIKENLSYRLTVTECVRPFSDSDKVLVETLSFYMEQILLHQKQSSVFYNIDLADILEDVLIKDLLNKSALDAELAAIGWNSIGHFQILCLKSADVSVEHANYSYYCQEIIEYFPECFAFQAGQDIAVIINMDISNRTEEELSQAITIFIRDTNFRIGISNTFFELYQIRKYFRQAEIALDIGLQAHPTEWSHRFGSNMLQYLFSMATSEFDKEDLFSPVYYRLKQYDEENETDLVRTLFSYLENNQNAVQTAKDLYIHRSTMLYRLKRICEIGKIGLSDRKELLHLYITAYLLEEV